jgi:hypothetical protein
MSNERHSQARLLVAALGLALLACGGARVPAEIAVEDPGLHAVLRVRARGVQVYKCAAGKTSAPPFAWTLVGPEATLYDGGGAAVGKHYAGPTWELTRDGSKVTGVVQSKAVVAADAVPWLRLTVATNAGAGILASARLVQRIETTGGLAPASGCEQASEGSETRVDYTATYVFWGAVPTTP